MEIRWDAAAGDDLETILSYIEEAFSFSNARLFRAEVIKLTEQIAIFPEMGKVEPLLEGQFRSIPINRCCKVVYTLMPDAILIIALWSTRRSPEAFKKEVTKRVK